MRIEEIKNEVAQEKGFETWFGLIDAYPHSTMSPEKLDELENEAMQRYAELKCKEQQIIDAKYVKSGVVCRKNEPPKIEVDKNSILNAPLATS